MKAEILVGAKTAFPLRPWVSPWGWVGGKAQCGRERQSPGQSAHLSQASGGSGPERTPARKSSTFHSQKARTGISLPCRTGQQGKFFLNLGQEFLKRPTFYVCLWCEFTLVVVWCENPHAAILM